MIKPRLNLRIGRLDLGIGWYSGEDFALFAMAIGENIGDISLTIFSMHIAKFCIFIGVFK